MQSLLVLIGHIPIPASAKHEDAFSFDRFGKAFIQPCEYVEKWATDELLMKFRNFAGKRSFTVRPADSDQFFEQPFDAVWRFVEYDSTLFVGDLCKSSTAAFFQRKKSFEGKPGGVHTASG